MFAARRVAQLGKTMIILSNCLDGKGNFEALEGSNPTFFVPLGRTAE